MKTPRTRNLMAAALFGACIGPFQPLETAWAKDEPNIVFILTDNLGYGEIGVYGGGLTRGGATPRIDTDDTGSDVTLLNRGNKDRAFGLGGELGVIWPSSKVNVLVRVIPEFGVRSRTQGLTFTAALGKSF